VLSTQSDERLVDLVRAGSDPAFEAIVERYRRALMRYVARLLPAERAEDVVQQAFVKAYEAMQRDSAELNLRPWLYRIAHNTALNALRDRALGHAQLDEQIDGVERPDQAFERVTGLRELLVAVQALPERQRDAIVLRELEGRSYEEIGAALGVTDGAVRQLLNRARNTLRSAAAAVIPFPLVTRVASSESADPLAARVAELVGVGSGALVMKVCATALVTGAVVGGTAVVPGGADRRTSVGAEAAQAAEDSSSAVSVPGETASSRAAGGGGERDARERPIQRATGPANRDDDDDSSSSGNGGGVDDDDHDSDDDDRHRGESGSGGGSGGSGSDDDDDSADDRSGPGGGGDDDEPELDDDSSGPGSGAEPLELPEPEEIEAAEDRSGHGGGSDDEPEDALEPDSSGPG
jgi:RNA polymerase sigma factor (sigma-70 family)